MSDVDALDLTSEVTSILNRRPAVGLALGVVRNGSLEFFHAHGEANIATHTPITPDTVFRVASITKTFTAIAVMQLWEQGLVDLDAPANDYLRTYQLIPAKASYRPLPCGTCSRTPRGSASSCLPAVCFARTSARA